MGVTASVQSSPSWREAGMGDAGQQGDGAESRTEPVAEGGPVRRPQGGCPQPTPRPHFTLGSSTALVLGRPPPLSQHQVVCPLSRVAYPSSECTSGVSMPKTHQSHSRHLGEPSSPGVLCGVRERWPDLSQPGPGDLSPLT